MDYWPQWFRFVNVDCLPAIPGFIVTWLWASVIYAFHAEERCFDRPDGQTWETEMKDERDGEITRGIR